MLGLFGYDEEGYLKEAARKMINDDYVEALKSTYKALSYGESPWPYLVIGMIYFAQKSYVKAIEFYEKAVTQKIGRALNSVQYFDINVAWGETLVGLERYDMALKKFETALEDYEPGKRDFYVPPIVTGGCFNKYDCWRSISNCAFKLAKYPKALEAANKAISYFGQDHYDFDDRYNQIRALVYIDCDHALNLVKTLRDHAQNSSDQPAAEDLTALCFYQRAQKYQSQADAQSALKWYQSAIKSATKADDKEMYQRNYKIAADFLAELLHKIASAEKQAAEQAQLEREQKNMAEAINKNIVLQNENLTLYSRRNTDEYYMVARKKFDEQLNNIKQLDNYDSGESSPTLIAQELEHIHARPALTEFYITFQNSLANILLSAASVKGGYVQESPTKGIQIKFIDRIVQTFSQNPLLLLLTRLLTALGKEWEERKQQNAIDHVCDFHVLNVPTERFVAAVARALTLAQERDIQSIPTDSKNYMKSLFNAFSLAYRDTAVKRFACDQVCSILEGLMTEALLSQCEYRHHEDYVRHVFRGPSQSTLQLHPNTRRIIWIDANDPDTLTSEELIVLQENADQYLEDIFKSTDKNQIKLEKGQEPSASQEIAYIHARPALEEYYRAFYTIMNRTLLSAKAAQGEFVDRAQENSKEQQLGNLLVNAGSFLPGGVLLKVIGVLVKINADLDQIACIKRIAGFFVQACTLATFIDALARELTIYQEKEILHQPHKILRHELADKHMQQIIAGLLNGDLPTVCSILDIKFRIHVYNEKCQADINFIQSALRKNAIRYRPLPTVTAINSNPLIIYKSHRSFMFNLENSYHLTEVIDHEEREILKNPILQTYHASFCLMLYNLILSAKCAQGKFSKLKESKIEQISVVLSDAGGLVPIPLVGMILNVLAFVAGKIGEADQLDTIRKIAAFLILDGEIELLN